MFVELCAHLDDEPLSLIQNEEYVNSFDSAVELLRNTYADLAQRYYLELESLRRGTKPIPEYNKEFDRLKNKAKPLLRPYLEIQLYVRGLDPVGLRDKLEINNPRTLRDAMELAQKLETRFQ